MIRDLRAALLSAPRAVVDQALQTRTRTSFGSVSDWRSVWSGEAQMIFDAAQGSALNTAFGFDP